MPRISPNKAITFQVYVDWAGDGSFTTLFDDVSRYVKECQRNIGADIGTDVVASIGSCTILLNNSPRYFSPENISSPLYGKVLPRKPIRIDITDGLRTETWFKGFIDSITPDSGDRLARETRIKCTDYLGILDGHYISMPVVTDKTSDELVQYLVNYALAPSYSFAAFMRNSAPAAGHYVEIGGVRGTFAASLASPNELLVPTGFRARYTAFETIKKWVNGEGAEPEVYHASSTRPVYVSASIEQSFYQVAQDDRPVRYYRMGESSGSTANDFGSNAANGTISGATVAGAALISGDADTSYSFDGTNDHVVTPVISLKNQSFTIETWIQPSASSPPALQVPWGFYAGAGTGEQLNLFILNTGEIGVYLAPSTVISAAGVITFGSTYHVLVTYDAVLDSMKLYVNGVLVASGATGPVTTNTCVFYVGDYLAVANPYKGLMKDWLLYFGVLPAARVVEHYAARLATPGVLVVSQLPGVGGSFTTAASGYTISTLSGSNALAGVLTKETGTQRFPYAGDGWGEEKTTSYKAIRQVVGTEVGGIGLGFYQDRDGLLYLRNRDHYFTKQYQPVAAQFERQSLHPGTTDIARIYNRIIVSYVPRSTVASGVVAKANAVHTVPGTGTVKDVGSGGVSNRPDEVNGSVNYKEFDMNYVDPSTGAKMAVTELVLPPEPITDWVAGENTDDESDFYNNFTYLNFIVKNLGTKAKVIITNKATGALKIFNLQLRGTGIAKYEKTQVVREDTESIQLYGRKVLNITLDLPVVPEFAEALADYLLAQFKDPHFEVPRAVIGNRITVDGYNMYALNIGDVVEITDSQHGISTVKHEIIGMIGSLRVSGDHDLSFMLRRVDTQQYALWDDPGALWDTAQWTV